MTAKTGVTVAGEKDLNGDGSINLKIPKVIWLPIVLGLISGGSIMGVFGNLLGQDDSKTEEKYVTVKQRNRDSLIYDRKFEELMDTMTAGNKMIREFIEKNQERKRK